MRSLAPSPLALALLDLSDRRADGTLAVGGRVLVLAKGGIVDVLGTASDESLDEFLEKAGRLSADALREVRREAGAAGGRFEEVVVRLGLMSRPAMRDVRRSLWLERFVRGIELEERDSVGCAPFIPQATSDANGTVSVLSFVLDALSRRAASGADESVGTRSDFLFHWEPSSPHRAGAERWAQLRSDPEGAELAQVLAQLPAARVAALIRAGIARIVSPEAQDIPPPPPRPPSYAPPPISVGERRQRNASATLKPPPLAPLPRETPLRPPPALANERLEALTAPPPPSHPAHALYEPPPDDETVDIRGAFPLTEPASSTRETDKPPALTRAIAPPALSDELFGDDEPTVETNAAIPEELFKRSPIPPRNQPTPAPPRAPSPPPARQLTAPPPPARQPTPIPPAAELPTAVPPPREAAPIPPRQPTPPPPRQPTPPPPRPPTPPPPEPVEITGPLPPALKLDPGVASAPATRPALVPIVELPQFPDATTRLDDPLDAIERRVAALEQSNAPEAARAAAWRDLGQATLMTLGSVEEAARAYREACAADPSDRIALERASMLCAAIGRSDLARAYARTAAKLGETPREQARLYERLSRLALRDGDAEEGASAALTATELFEDDTALELAFFAQRTSADTLGAITTARRLASLLAPSRPDRARAWLAWAIDLRADPSLVPEDEHHEYAAALAIDGFGEGAVAWLARLAHTRSPDERRRLLIEAAELAERADRHDLASDCLLRIFEDEPEIDSLHEPLLAYLEAAGATADRAIVLERIASLSPPLARGFWLTRAADAHLELAGGAEWAMELFARALSADPGAPRPLEALREYAAEVRDPALLADALERALRRAPDHEVDARAMLADELLDLAQNELASTPIALFAADQRVRAMPGDIAALEMRDQLRVRVKAERTIITLAERELEIAPLDARPQAARKLAALLRESPHDRERAASLYREALTGTGADATAVRALERIAFMLGDDTLLLEMLERRAQLGDGRRERARFRQRYAELASLLGEHHKAAEASRDVLLLQPQNRAAVARLGWLARMIRDPELEIEAIAQRATTCPDPRERARWLARLAELREELGDVEGALEDSWQSLRAHPRSAGAALVLLAHLEHEPPDRQLAAHIVQRTCFGTSVPVLSRIAHAAQASGQQAAYEEATEVIGTLAPTDSVAAARRLALAIAGTEVPYIVRCAEEALESAASRGSLTDLIREAIERVAELGALRDAASLGLMSVDRLLDPDTALASRVLALAEAAADVELRAGALDRLAARTVGHDRVVHLVQLADLHRAERLLPAEARTWLRVLAETPYDDRATARLTQIYATCGEDERLLAVLALRLEGAEPSQRIERRLAIATAAALCSDDPDRAVGFLRAGLEEDRSEDAVAIAAGALRTLAMSDRACELLAQVATERGGAEAGRHFERAIAIAEQDLGRPDIALQLAVAGLRIAPTYTPLLLAFERHAHAERAIELAQKTYDALAQRAMGPHGRRALVYRKARWLEMAGDASAALDAFAASFEVMPSGGAIFQAIDRLSAQVGRREPFARAASVLAAQATVVDLRLSLSRKAAKALAEEIGDVSGAFELLAAVWRDTQRSELVPDLRDIARRLAKQRPATDPAVVDAYARIESGLRDRAEKAWELEDKLGVLIELLDVRASDRHDAESSKAMAAEIERVAKSEPLEPDVHGRVLAKAAERVAAIDKAEAERLVAASVSIGGVTEDIAAARRAIEAPRVPIEPAPAPKPEPASENDGEMRAARLAQRKAEAVAALQRPSGDFPPVDLAPVIEQHQAEQAVAPTAPTQAAERKSTARLDELDEPSRSAPPEPGRIPRGKRSTRPGFAAVTDPDAAMGPLQIAVRDSYRPPAAVPEPEPKPEPDDAPAGDGAPEPARSSAPPPPRSPSHPPSEPPGVSSKELALSAPFESGETRVEDYLAATGTEPSHEAAPRGRRPDKFQKTLPLGQVVPRQLLPSDSSPPEPSATEPSEDELRTRSASGDVGAMHILAARLARIGQPREAAMLLRSAFVASLDEKSGELRLDSLRLLRDTTARAGMIHLHEVVIEILSLFDPAAQRPAHPGIAAVRGVAAYADEAMFAVEGAALGPLVQALALVWEGASPLFRESLEESGVMPRDRIAPFGAHPLAEPYAEAIQMLRPGDVAIYAHGGTHAMRVARTHPPSIVAPDHLEPDAAAIRFRVGRAIELARAGHVLLATLERSQGELLLSAVAAAFGPADRPKSAREATRLGAELFRTMPARLQGRVRDLMVDRVTCDVPYQTVRAAIDTAAVRAGLLLAGSVSSALRAIAVDDPTLEGADLASDLGFGAAAHASPTLRALLRFALDDAYLAARTQAQNAS